MFRVSLFIIAVSAFGQTTSIYLPPVGLAGTETAQVNVVNAAPMPTPGPVGPFCSGTVVFYGGADGASVLGKVAAFQVAFGQMFSVALPYSATGATGARSVIRVAITLSPFKVPTDSGPQITPCSLVASLETFDTVTGVTHAVVAASGTADFSGDVAQVRGGAR